METTRMPRVPGYERLFTLSELARAVRAYADKQAARYDYRAHGGLASGRTRVPSSGLAELMEMQPIR